MEVDVSGKHDYKSTTVPSTQVGTRRRGVLGHITNGQMGQVAFFSARFVCNKKVMKGVPTFSGVQSVHDTVRRALQARRHPGPRDVHAGPDFLHILRDGA